MIVQNAPTTRAGTRDAATRHRSQEMNCAFESSFGLRHTDTLFGTRNFAQTSRQLSWNRLSSRVRQSSSSWPGLDQLPIPLLVKQIARSIWRVKEDVRGSLWHLAGCSEDAFTDMLLWPVQQGPIEVLRRVLGSRPLGDCGHVCVALLTVQDAPQADELVFCWSFAVF